MDLFTYFFYSVSRTLEHRLGLSTLLLHREISLENCHGPLPTNDLRRRLLSMVDFCLPGRIVDSGLPGSRPQDVDRDSVKVSSCTFLRVKEKLYTVT